MTFPRDRGTRRAIEAGLLGGGTVMLPAGVALDQALLLDPPHAGCTLKGVGPATVLRNSHATKNSVNSAGHQRPRIAYMHGRPSVPTARLILSDTVPAPASVDQPGIAKWASAAGHRGVRLRLRLPPHHVPAAQKRTSSRSFDPGEARLDVIPSPTRAADAQVAGRPPDCRRAGRPRRGWPIPPLPTASRGRYVLATAAASTATVSIGACWPATPRREPLLRPAVTRTLPPWPASARDPASPSAV